RPGAEADWWTSGSDAAVYVQLAAGFRVPSADVGSLRAYEGETPVDERERQLAAVAVTGQRQVDAQLGGAIKAVGIVAAKDVDYVRHHQVFASLEVPVNNVPVMVSGESRLLIVNADQVEHFDVRLNGCPLLAQDANPRSSKEPCDGILGFSIELMVAKAAENTERRAKVRKRLHHLSLR